jgi:hypothetical protein
MPLLETFANASTRGYGSFLPATGGGPAYEQIATTVLGSSTSTITFSSIPTTYKHLQVRGVFNANTSNTVTGLNWRFNGSSSVEYNAHYLYGDGSSMYSQQNGADTQIPIQLNTLGNGASSIFSVMTLDILDYAATTKNKTTRALGGNGVIAPRVILGSGLWINTSAINSITFYLNSGIQFFTGTRISLYGIKG